MKTIERINELPSPTANRHEIERLGAEVTRERLRDEREHLGQFLTPAIVAQFMASLFSKGRHRRITLLDPGAGVGALAAAFLDRSLAGDFGRASVHVDAYELDEPLIPHLKSTLERYRTKGSSTHVEVHRGDFVAAAVNAIQFNGRRDFTHAILNPPYKKISSDSAYRLLLRAVGIETVNAYTAFLALVIELMAPRGEVVAIIPRSFCNGPYYRPFRELLLARCAIEHIHLFESRSSAFKGDDVLQENIIIKLVQAKKQGKVVVSTSRDALFTDVETHQYRFTDIVHPEDKECFIHIPREPSQTTAHEIPLARATLEEIGVGVSTGPVVDFRMTPHLRLHKAKDAVPLIYAHHFADGKLSWPREHKKKPNAITVNDDTKKWLMPRGSYALVKRFSSKEERRRVVAYALNERELEHDLVGIENHLNVFHEDKQGLPEDLALGLVAYLNSTAIDDYFRRFSGHTQVNATDLRQLKYPLREELERLGRWAKKHEPLTQEQIDSYLKENAKR